VTNVLSADGSYLCKKEVTETYVVVAVCKITPTIAIQQHRMTVLRLPSFQLRGAMIERPITSPSRMPAAMKVLYLVSVGLPIAFAKYGFARIPPITPEARAVLAKFCKRSMWEIC
jgi:hypothetical protein